jgi:hypothetical protein
MKCQLTSSSTHVGTPYAAAQFQGISNPYQSTISELFNIDKGSAAIQMPKGDKRSW